VCATRTPAPKSQPPPRSGPTGAFIELRVRFPEEGLDFHWQELWTIVQWQDGFGRLHDVEGWQGTLDQVSRTGREVVGNKTWWLARDLFTKGPFGWIVYRVQSGAVVAKSEPFFLPDTVGEVETVEIIVGR
jgi:hypothetical protein